MHLAVMSRAKYYKEVLPISAEITSTSATKSCETTSCFDANDEEKWWVSKVTVTQWSTNWRSRQSKCNKLIWWPNFFFVTAETTTRAKLPGLSSAWFAFWTKKLRKKFLQCRDGYGTMVSRPRNPGFASRILQFYLCVCKYGILAEKIRNFHSAPIYLFILYILILSLF